MHVSFSQSRAFGMGCALVAALLWSLPPIVVRHLSDVLDPYSMNFYRYGCAAVVVLGAVWVRHGHVWQRLSRNWRGILLTTLPNLIHQTAWAVSIALRLTPPAYATLLERATVPFSVLLSFMFLAEERRVIRHPLYLLGLAVALAGMVGLSLNPAEIGHERTSVGIVLILVAAATWSFYVLFVRLMLHHLDSATAFCGVSLSTAAGLGVLCLLFGAPGTMLGLSFWNHVILITSGIACVGGSHTLYYAAQRRLGIAAGIVTFLLTPLLTAVWSHFLFRERFSAGDWAFGLLLLSGSIAIFYTKQAETLPREE